MDKKLLNGEVEITTIKQVENISERSGIGAGWFFLSSPPKEDKFVPLMKQKGKYKDFTRLKKLFFLLGVGCRYVSTGNFTNPDTDIDYTAIFLHKHLVWDLAVFDIENGSRIFYEGETYSRRRAVMADLGIKLLCSEYKVTTKRR